MFWHRKSTPLTLENLDARLRLVEAMLCTPRAVIERRDLASVRDELTCSPGAIERALESYARAGGYEMPEKPRDVD